MQLEMATKSTDVRAEVELTLEQAKTLIREAKDFFGKAGSVMVRGRMVDLTCFETVSTYGFYLTDTLVVHFARKAALKAKGEVVSPLRLYYDADMMSHLDDNAGTETPFWWCKYVSEKKEDKEWRRVLVGVDPNQATHVMFCTEARLHAEYCSAQSPTYCCQLSAQENGSQAVARFVQIVPVGFTSAVYEVSFDECEVEAFVKLRADEYVARHMAALEQERANQQTELDMLRSTLEARAVYLADFLKLHERIERFRLSKMQKDWPHYRFQLATEDHPERRLDGFKMGGILYKYTAEALAQATHAVEEAMADAEMRDRARKVSMAFMNAAGCFPVRIVDLRASRHSELEGARRVQGVFRSALTVTVRDTYVNITDGNNTLVRGVTFSECDGDEVALERMAHQKISAAYRANRSWIGKLYDWWTKIP